MTAPVMSHRPRASGGGKPGAKAKRLNVTKLSATEQLFEDDSGLAEPLSAASTPTPTPASPSPGQLHPHESVRTAALPPRASAIPPAKSYASSSSNVRPRARGGGRGGGRSSVKYYREEEGGPPHTAEDGEGWDQEDQEFYEEMGDGWDWGFDMAGSLGTAIPDKLREIHEMLVEEDDVETPDELVKPIESLLSSGLSSFGFLGRTALAVGTSVDNALEGALDLVQTMGEVTMRATTGIDFGELDDEDEEDEDEERYSAEADGSHYDDLSSRSSSRADSAASNSRAASGRSSVRESSGRGRSTAAPTAPTATATAAAAAAAAKTQPLHKPSAAQTVDGGGKRPPTATSAAAVSPASGGGSGGGAAKVAPGGGALKNGVRRTGSPGFADFSEWPAEFLAPMPQTSAQAKPKKAKKAGADPVLEYERKAFRLEQMLEELRDEMRSTGVETKDTQKVLDNLTDNLRTTQMQCQSLRSQRQKSASPSPSPAAAAAASASASAASASAAASPSTPPPVSSQPRPPAQMEAAEPTTPTPTAAAAAAEEEAVTPLAPPPTTAKAPREEVEAQDLFAEQMRLQMEALLREKAELAAANARLARENESLHELLDYHQGSDDYDDYEVMQPQ